MGDGSERLATMPSSSETTIVDLLSQTARRAGFEGLVQYHLRADTSNNQQYRNPFELKPEGEQIIFEGPDPTTIPQEMILPFMESSFSFLLAIEEHPRLEETLSSFFAPDFYPSINSFLAFGRGYRNWRAANKQIELFGSESFSHYLLYGEESYTHALQNAFNSDEDFDYQSCLVLNLMQLENLKDLVSAPESSAPAIIWTLAKPLTSIYDVLEESFRRGDDEEHLARLLDFALDCVLTYVDLPTSYIKDTLEVAVPDNPLLPQKSGFFDSSPEREAAFKLIERAVVNSYFSPRLP